MYDIGDTVPLAVDVKDSAGAAANATAIALAIILPDGTTLDPAPSITNPPATTGRYVYDFVPTEAGRHHFRWTATDPDAAFTDIFDVAPATRGIVSLVDAKGYLKIPLTTTTLDDELRVTIGAVTSVIENVTGAVLVREVVETWSGGRRGLVLCEGPIISIDEVTENGTALADSQWSLSDTGILYRLAGAYTAGCWRAGLNNVQVTYTVGRPVATMNLVEAAKELIRINFRPQQGGNYSPFDRGEQGSDSGVWRLGFFIPHGVMALLQPDRDPGGFF